MSLSGLSIGVAFAFLAVLFWGVGDFLIQRSARKIGDWELLFLITLIGTIILTPFVYSYAIKYVAAWHSLLVLMMVSILMFSASLIDFEALKEGKIAIVEPVYAIEIPVVLVLSLYVINEVLTPFQTILVMLIVIGLVLVSIKQNVLKTKKLERGVALAAASALLLGATSFLVGFGARITNPLLINWFFSVTILVYAFIYLFFTKRLHKLIKDAKRIEKLFIVTSVLDNLAWITYAIATILIPITIAVAISENYIAVAALLGLIVNKEKILAHQKAGLILALASAVLLAYLV